VNFLSKNFFRKEKFIKKFLLLFSLKKWQLLLGTFVAAEFFTFVLNSVQSLIWWHFWSFELIIIGTIDALFIVAVLAPLVIGLAIQTTKYSEYKKKAEEEAKAQAELSEGEKKFRLYLENSVDVVTVIDANGYIIYESPSSKKNFGYDSADLIGRSAFEFVHPDDLKIVIDVFKGAIQKPYSSKTVELRFLKKNGEWANVRVSGKNMISDPIIKGIVLNIFDITERIQIENQLKKNIVEKDMLMKEIHHRVKNNFMTVSSLLFLQSELVNEPKVTEVFLECQNRIRSMALIHEKLYQSETLSEIDVHSYVQRLVSYIKSSYITGSTNVSINLEIDHSIRLDPEKAISMGLIINELLSNIFKYAFKDKESGNVRIELFRRGDNYNLMVKDNGVGLPKDFNISSSNSLGFRLVEMMSAQMNGKLIISGNNGSEFKIEFPA
jgi:two-component system, sensor histidine kinase PdtaS